MALAAAEASGGAQEVLRAGDSGATLALEGAPGGRRRTWHEGADPEGGEEGLVLRGVEEASPPRNGFRESTEGHSPKAVPRADCPVPGWVQADKKELGEVGQYKPDFASIELGVPPATKDDRRATRPWRAGLPSVRSSWLPRNSSELILRQGTATHLILLTRLLLLVAIFFVSLAAVLSIFLTLPKLSSLKQGEQGLASAGEAGSQVLQEPQVLLLQVRGRRLT